MSDKKEIATLSIKISVDSTDLDKLEVQLKRIKGLMVSTGLKQPTSVGFSADKFFVANGQMFIDSSYITSATIPSVNDALRQAAKEGARKGAEQARFEITTGINDNREQVSAEVALKSSAEISRTSEAISREQSAFEKFKQQVETRFNELQSQTNHTQCASAASEQSRAQHLSGLQRQITQLSSELEEARLKGSLNAINIISIKQTMEQQEKAMAEAVIKTVATDLCRGGTLSRMLWIPQIIRR